MTTKRALFAISASSLLLGACASAGPIGTAPSVTYLETAELPSPFAADMTDRTMPALLGPADELTISVVGVDFLTGLDLRVDSAGEINFPLAGPVRVVGRTPRELEQIIAARLVQTGQLIEPMVSVNVKEALSQRITIEGEVRRPGLYPATQRLTLLQAIALAQGTSEYSDLDEVIVYRTVGGQRYAALYDLQAVRRGNYEDPRIFPDDIITVGDARGRRLFEKFVQFIPALTTPLILALNNN
ncbi:MAG: polysaccharide biosynthesis/export family protein [Erythrobacter sp.]